VDIFLLLVVPLIGGLFGIISTRRLIQRIHSLATATTLFAEGHYEQPLPVLKKDEVGQLEQHFNQMAEQLVESIAQRQKLAEQGARQRERNRIARDLHDSVKQQTFALSIQISTARALLDQHKDAARKHLLEAETLAYQVQQELTTLIHELRSSALQDYVLSWSRQYSITADINVPETCILPATVEEALLRVTREALSNIARHSHATRVQVSLECSPEQTMLSIADNGQGFNPDSLNSSGVGLHSMRERLEALGGTVSIESTTGQGTRLVAYCACAQG
jgi:NarL family two-component system sensor histidine kinase LiaS